MKVVRATDDDGNDALRFHPITVIVNGVKQNAEGLSLTGGERGGIPEGQTEFPNYEIFNKVVGKKGDDLHFHINYKVKEIDGRPGSQSDNGAANYAGPLVDEQTGRVLKCENALTHLPQGVIIHTVPAAANIDTEDNTRPRNKRNGFIEVLIHVEIDP